MRRELPEINAGSMADIAFLLLIFFLVTTIIDTNKGIFTKLPRKEALIDPIPFKEKNILDIIINPNNELLVENEITDMSNLTEIARNFIDNGGGTDSNGKKCTWCKGEKDPASSDHPTKALIAIDASRNAEYGTYINVLDCVHSAYAKLRDEYALNAYGISYKEMVDQGKKHTDRKEFLRAQIKEVRTKYPLLVTDTEIQN